MDITEKKVITLENDTKYYILDDLGSPIDEQAKYLFAIGITPDWEFDVDDVVFLKNYREGDKEMIIYVEEDDPMYEKVSNLEAVKIRLETDPKYRNELEKALEQIEESSL